MVHKILLMVLVIFVVYLFYIMRRDKEVYEFTKMLSYGAYRFLSNNLNYIQDLDDELDLTEKQWDDLIREHKELSKKVYALRDKYSYIRLLFSFRPLTLEEWFTEEEREYFEYNFIEGESEDDRKY